MSRATSKAATVAANKSTGMPSFSGAGARLKAKMKAGNITLPDEDEVPF
jgi:hypothetical protein